MERIYTLDILYSKENLINAIKDEMIKYLEKNKDEKMEISELYKIAIIRITEKIIKAYDTYDLSEKSYSDYTLQNLHESLIQFAANKKDSEIIHSKVTYLYIISMYNQLAGEENQSIQEIKNRITHITQNNIKTNAMIHEAIGPMIEKKVPILDCIFKETKNNDRILEEWIKPYVQKFNLETIVLLEELFTMNQEKDIKNRR